MIVPIMCFVDTGLAPFVSDFEADESCSHNIPFCRFPAVVLLVSTNTYREFYLYFLFFLHFFQKNLIFFFFTGSNYSNDQHRDCQKISKMSFKRH